MNTPESKPWIDPAGSKIPAYKRKAANRNFLVEPTPEPSPVQEHVQEYTQELPSLDVEFHDVTAPYPNLRILMLGDVMSAIESGNVADIKEQIDFIKNNPALIERFNEILNPLISNEEALTKARDVNMSLEPKPVHEGRSKRLFTCHVGTTGRRAILAVSKNGRVDFEVSNQ